MIQNKYKIISIKYEKDLSAYIKSDDFPMGIPIGTLIECAKRHPLLFSFRAVKSREATNIEIHPNGTPFVLEVPSDGRILWIKGLLAPCLFIGIASRDENGYYREAVYGHFSAVSIPSEYQALFDALCANSKRDLDLRLTGYTGRTTIETLDESVAKLCTNLRKNGINVNHTIDRERAIVTHGDNQKVISDLGLDIGKEKGYSRRFLWGIGKDINILFSFVYESDSQTIQQVTIIQ